MVESVGAALLGLAMPPVGVRVMLGLASVSREPG
jgi:hypothetical protein